jgi:hypothetical protein
VKEGRWKTTYSRYRIDQLGSSIYQHSDKPQFSALLRNWDQHIVRLDLPFGVDETGDKQKFRL